MMRNYIFLFLIFTGMAMASCNSTGGKSETPTNYKEKEHKPIKIALTNYPEQYPVFSVADTSYDFGSIKEGDVVQYQFRFKNSGTKPLIITNASSTCGCTVPQYPKEPVAPGKEGILKVVFNSTNKSGRQFKPIYVTANTMPAHFKLQITADVISK